MLFRHKCYKLIVFTNVKGYMPIISIAFRVLFKLTRVYLGPQHVKLVDKQPKIGFKIRVSNFLFPATPTSYNQHMYQIWTILKDRFDSYRVPNWTNPQTWYKGQECLFYPPGLGAVVKVAGFVNFCLRKFTNIIFIPCIPKVQAPHVFLY